MMKVYYTIKFKVKVCNNFDNFYIIQFIFNQRQFPKISLKIADVNQK